MPLTFTLLNVTSFLYRKKVTKIIHFLIFFMNLSIHTKQIFKLSKLIFLSNGNKYVAVISSRSLLKIGNLNCSKLAKHCKSQRREGKARQMQPILDFATADSLCVTCGWRDLEVVMTHINFRTIFFSIFEIIPQLVFNDFNIFFFSIFEVISQLVFNDSSVCYILLFY